MHLKKNFLLTIPDRGLHAMPHRATCGTPGFSQEAEAGVKSVYQNLYWGLCGKGKAGQGEHVRISQVESLWQALG